MHLDIAKLSLSIVDSTGIPTGNVTLWDGNKKLGTSDLDSSGRATFSISTLSKGNHSITVKYGGDGDYNDSISQTLIQVVNQK